MKFLKLIAVMAVSVATLSANATTTAKVKLSIASEDNNCTYLINQNDAVANDFSSANCLTLPANPQEDAIFLYTLHNSAKYNSVELNDINGVEVIFEPNNYETSYTLTLSNVMGDNLKVMRGDQEVVSPYEMTGVTAPITFTIVMETTQKDYTRDAATVIGNWYTICVPGGVDVTEYASVMDVYTVAGYNAAQGLAVDPLVGAMQPGVPYIFQARATLIEFDYNEDAEAGSPQEGANYLTGTFEDMQTANVAYVVANDMLNWAAIGTAVPANRAYLNYADITDGTFPVVNANAPGRKFIAPKAMPTELDEVAAGMADGTYMINGQVVLVKGGKMFNVLGL